MCSRAVRVAAGLATFAGAAIATALLHHGHIVAYLGMVQGAVARGLPKRFGRPRWNARPSVLQLYFAKPDVHYEVWVQRKARALEIGLHFEGDRETNRRWAELLAERSLEVQSKLGPNVELEEWGRGWTRLHEVRSVGRESWQPKRDFTEALAHETAERLLRYVNVLEPMLRKLARGRGPRPASGGEGARAASRSATAPQRGATRRA